jgi:hypothetical protein
MPRPLRFRWGRTAPERKRLAARRARAEGMTLDAIAKVVVVSRRRVLQILEN